jgi:DNA-binding protein YbaB
MFDKFKQLYQLQKIKDVLEKERREVEKEGVRVIVNGKMEIEDIKLNPELSIEKQERIIKDCINEAMQQIQRQAAQTAMKNLLSS